MGCGFESFLDERLLGDVAAGALDAYKRHLPACAPCRERFDRAEYLTTLLVGSLRRVEAALPPPREAVLARLDGSPRAVRDSGRGPAGARPRRMLRFPRLFLALNVFAALALLCTHLAYVAVWKGAERRARASLARTDVRTLGITIEAYRRGEKSYPPDGIRAVVRALSRTREASGQPYYAFRPDQLGPSDDSLDYRDPWGHSYVYRAADPGPLVLYSLGENGTDEGGGGDDIAFAR